MTEQAGHTVTRWSCVMRHVAQGLPATLPATTRSVNPVSPTEESKSYAIVAGMMAFSIDNLILVVKQPSRSDGVARAVALV